MDVCDDQHTLETNTWILPPSLGQSLSAEPRTHSALAGLLWESGLNPLSSGIAGRGHHAHHFLQWVLGIWAPDFTPAQHSISWVISLFPALFLLQEHQCYWTRSQTSWPHSTIIPSLKTRLQMWSHGMSLREDTSLTGFVFFSKTGHSELQPFRPFSVRLTSSTLHSQNMLEATRDPWQWVVLNTRHVSSK